MAVRGGKNLKRLLKKGQRAKGVDGVRVGLFSSAVYPRIGTGKHGKRSGYRKSRRRLPVTTVAAWIEFGTRSRSGKVLMKARPVMRSANVQLEQKVRALLRAHVDPETMVVNRRVANLVGHLCVRTYQETVHTFKPPPVDTGFYKRSFTHEIIEYRK